jgi:hypothetical protein
MDQNHKTVQIDEVTMGKGGVSYRILGPTGEVMATCDSKEDAFFIMEAVVDRLSFQYAKNGAKVK